jgi:hypothetical protein
VSLLDGAPAVERKDAALHLDVTVAPDGQPIAWPCWHVVPTAMDDEQVIASDAVLHVVAVEEIQELPVVALADLNAS